MDGRRQPVTAKKYLALVPQPATAGAPTSNGTLTAHAWPECGGAVGDHNVEQPTARLGRKLTATCQSPPPQHQPEVGGHLLA